MFSILCIHFFIAHEAKITAKTGAIDVNQRFLVMNQISVDII